MSFLVESQQDPRWSGVELGWGPPGSTIGLYGCLLTDFSMVAIDTGHNLNPAQLNAAMVAHGGIFVTCGGGDVDHDCLPSNALDILFPGEYQTHEVAGFDAAGIKAAVDSSDTYAIVFISTARVPTHFAIVYSDTAAYLADPAIGKVDTLAGYGGPAAVKKVIYVRHLKPAPAPPPPPPPTPAPTPTPPPQAPIWVVENDADVVIGSPYTTLVDAQGAADQLAAAAPGRKYVVEDQSGVEVYTADVVPPPPPPGPTPGPNPPPAADWVKFLLGLIALIRRIFGGGS